MPQTTAAGRSVESLQDRCNRLEAELKRAGRRRWISIAGVILIFLGLDLVYLLWTNREQILGEQLSSLMQPAPSTNTGTSMLPELIEIRTQPVEERLNLVGTIVPGKDVNVTAPFEGEVTEMNFTYGERVERDQLLFRLDTSDMQIKLRTAVVAHIEAQQQLQELSDWENSSEVATATRELAAAEEDRNRSRSTLHTNQQLYEEGIISRDELSETRSSYNEAERRLDAARGALDAARKKGDEQSLRVAALKLENAKAEAAKYQELMGRAAILSPVSGIALKPTQGSLSDNQEPAIALGSNVAARQTLVTIGDMETIKVDALVSELDVESITPGLEVEVTSESSGGLVLPGHVVSVGSQAIKTAGQPLANYPVSIEIDMPMDQESRSLRLGIGVQISVTTYSHDSAIIVPQSAVVDRGGKFYVERLNQDSNEISDVEIVLGRVLPEGIEVHSGMREGDRIVRYAN